MDNWRTHILQELSPDISHLFLVSDSDDLLLEEDMLLEIQEKSFNVVTYEDPLAFRYLYESSYRCWSKKESSVQYLIVRTSSKDLNLLPYDLLQRGQKISIDLGQLFPNLSYPVVAALSRNYMDDLYQVSKEQRPENLGDKGTCDFILRYVFQIIPEIIQSPSYLLRVLLRIHHGGLQLSDILKDYFLQVLKAKNIFKEWPLEDLLGDRQVFFSFLQERWPIFLDHLVSSQSSQVMYRDLPSFYGLKDPIYLPFDHDDVRVYIDSLFFDGQLKPVSFENSHLLEDSWVQVGIIKDPYADGLRRLKGLIHSLQETLPSSKARHDEWLSFAYRWAELTTLRIDLKEGLENHLLKQLEILQKNVDDSFYLWMKGRYGGLYNQPAVPPVMGHHIPRTLERMREDNLKGRVMLLVVDGLSLSQWLIIRNILEDQCTIKIEERAVFAWVPTLTSVARQAIFSGKPPFYFPGSIHTTDKEESLWVKYWMDQGLTTREIIYKRGLGDNDFSLLKEIAMDPLIKVAGLIVNRVDRIMHGMELGDEGMHNQICQWASQGYLSQLLRVFLDEGFEIVLTSDHGNMEACGFGRPVEGAVADVKGERVRIYPDRDLRKKVKRSFLEAIEWPALGLPNDYLPLLAPDRLAFVKEGKRVVAHGGISIEEVIVPYIVFKGRIV